MMETVIYNSIDNKHKINKFNKELQKHNIDYEMEIKNCYLKYTIYTDELTEQQIFQYLHNEKL